LVLSAQTAALYRAGNLHPLVIEGLMPRSADDYHHGRQLARASGGIMGPT
jgi:hypothetical protein